jgi:hypothetical protein
MSYQPIPRVEIGLLYEGALPWSNHEVHAGDLRLAKESAHQIECMTLQTGDAGGELSGGQQDLHGWTPLWIS